MEFCVVAVAGPEFTALPFRTYVVGAMEVVITRKRVEGAMEWDT
jgi:hypothetical protein